MHINFNHIHAENFLSYETLDLDLNDSGFTMIKGINENPDDSSSSNGAGKSSVLEAIAWSLTGETIRGTKEVKRFNSDGACKVELNCTVDGNEYVIIRTKDPSNLFLYINGDNKSGKGIRDTQKILADYLPDLTAQLLGSVIILGQGLPQRFSNNSPSGRKEVLEQLSKSDFMLEDLKGRLSARKDSISTNIRKLEDEKLSLTTEKTMLSNQLLTNTTKLEEVNNKDKDLLQSTLETIVNEIKNHTDNKTKLETTHQNLVEQLENKAKEKHDIEMSDIKTKQSIKAKYEEPIMQLNMEYASKTSSINALKKEIQKIQNMKDTCPTCGQKLPNVHIPNTETQENEIRVLTTECAEIKAKLDEMNAKMNLECSETTQIYKVSLDNVTIEHNNLKKDSEKCYQEIKDCENSIIKLTKQSNDIQQSIDTIEHDKELLSSMIVSLQDKLDEIDKKVLYNTNVTEDTKLHLDTINKMDNLIKRDFRGYLLTNVINFIDKKAKEYSLEVFGTDKISFCIDGNNLSISYCGKEYENLSGGERQRIDLIIQFAIRDMLCNYLNFSSNIIVLDEIIDNLDSFGCQKVFDLINSCLKDVDSVYIISHHAEIPLPIDHEIIIVKGADGISRIKQ